MIGFWKWFCCSIIWAFFRMRIFYRMSCFNSAFQFASLLGYCFCIWACGSTVRTLVQTNCFAIWCTCRSEKRQPSRFRFPTDHRIGVEHWRGRGLQYEWERTFVALATRKYTSVFTGFVASPDSNVRQSTVHIDAFTEKHRLPHIVASDSVWVIFWFCATRLQDEVIPHAVLLSLIWIA